MTRTSRRQHRQYGTELSSPARIVVALTAAAVLPLAATVALIPVRSSVPTPTVALTLAAVVTLLAATGTRGTAAIAAVSASGGDWKARAGELLDENRSLIDANRRLVEKVAAVRDPNRDLTRRLNAK